VHGTQGAFLPGTQIGRKGWLGSRSIESAMNGGGLAGVGISSRIDSWCRISRWFVGSSSSSTCGSLCQGARDMDALLFTARTACASAGRQSARQVHIRPRPCVTMANHPDGSTRAGPPPPPPPKPKKAQNGGGGVFFFFFFFFGGGGVCGLSSTAWRTVIAVSRVSACCSTQRSPLRDIALAHLCQRVRRPVRPRPRDGFLNTGGAYAAAWIYRSVRPDQTQLSPGRRQGTHRYKWRGCVPASPVRDNDRIMVATSFCQSGSAANTGAPTKAVNEPMAKHLAR